MNWATTPGEGELPGKGQRSGKREGRLQPVGVYRKQLFFCRSVVHPFSPAPSNSTLHHTSFSHQNARGCADTFICCNAICGGCENEQFALRC